MAEVIQTPVVELLVLVLVVLMVAGVKLLGRVARPAKARGPRSTAAVLPYALIRLWWTRPGLQILELHRAH